VIGDGHQRLPATRRIRQPFKALIESIGFDAVDAGGLKNARYLEPVAGLNIYSDATDAFDERARATGLVLATHGGLLMNTMLANDRVRNLQRALASNRQIGVAIGVLMLEHRLTQAQAFDVLRAASQDSNRKLTDVAIEVIDTGTLNIRGWPANPKKRLAIRPARV